MSPSDPFRERFEVPVDGGNLAVWRAGPPVGSGAPVVLAAHGITASHIAWAPVARALADEEVCLLVPDLRGRGDSATVAGPVGIRAHVADLAAVVDRVGVPSVTLAGHSMGCWVVAMFARARPDLVSALVVVDGGIPMEVQHGVSPEQALAAVLGPALGRLARTFPSREVYHDFWRTHPAFAGTGIADADLMAYADHDLGGDPPTLQPRTTVAAVRIDYTQMLLDDEVRGALASVRVPAVLLRAPRGLLNEDKPFVPAALADAYAADAPDRRRVVMVEDTNHYSITLSEHGASAVAVAIRAQVANSVR